MRKIAFLFLALNASNAALAEGDVPRFCYSQAESAVKNGSDREYDLDGIRALSCSIATNNRAVICEVGAMKGDGAASDTWQVVLNRSCTHTFRIELTGEE